MYTLDINTEELDSLFTDLEDEMPHILETAMDETLRYLHQQLPPYPDGQAGPLPRMYTRQPEKRGFKTAKQRRYFFAALREGKIKPHGGAYRSKFKSWKQQAYFFWAVRSGEIQIPYRRTGTLQRTITTESTLQGDTVIGRIGTALEYAPYVIGDDSQQAPIHQGRWWQLADEVKGNLEDAARVFEEAAWRKIQQVLGE